MVPLKDTSAFAVLVFISLDFSADSVLRRNFKEPQTANIHLSIDGPSNRPELFHFSQAVFLLQTAPVPLRLNV